MVSSHIPKHTPSERSVVPWQPVESVRILLLGYLVLPLIFFSLVLLGFPRLEAGERFVLEQLMPMASWLLVLAGLWRRYGGALFQALALRPERPAVYYLREMLRLLTAMIGLMLLITWLTQAGRLAPGNPFEAFTSAEMKVIGLVAVVVSPVLEEVVFRGYLQSTFYKVMARPAAILLTALIFTLFHNMYLREPLAIVYVFSLGLLLGYFRERTGSILPGMGGHLFNNLLATGVLVLGRG